MGASGDAFLLCGGHDQKNDQCRPSLRPVVNHAARLLNRCSKYNDESYAAYAPLREKRRAVAWWSRSKNAGAAFTRASRQAQSSPWVTSRRNCHHRLASGVSHGLEVGQSRRTTRPAAARTTASTSSSAGVSA